MMKEKKIDHEEERIEIIIYMDEDGDVKFCTLSIQENKIDNLLRAMGLNYRKKGVPILLVGDGRMLAEIARALKGSQVRAAWIEPANDESHELDGI